MAQVPTRATDVMARGLSRAAVVRWQRGEARGYPITRQTVIVYRFGKKVDAINVRRGVGRARVEGLKPGRGYSFRVIEWSRGGRSPKSAASERVRIFR